jgi:hypothetical protein
MMGAPTSAMVPAVRAACGQRRLAHRHVGIDECRQQPQQRHQHGGRGQQRLREEEVREHREEAQEEDHERIAARAQLQRLQRQQHDDQGHAGVAPEQRAVGEQRGALASPPAGPPATSARAAGATSQASRPRQKQHAGGQAVHHSGRLATCGITTQAITASRNSVSRPSRGRALSFWRGFQHSARASRQRRLCASPLRADLLPRQAQAIVHAQLARPAAPRRTGATACARYRGGRPAQSPATAPAAAPAGCRGSPARPSHGPGCARPASTPPASAGRRAVGPHALKFARGLGARGAAPPLRGSPGGRGGGCASGAGYTSTWAAGRHTVHTRKVPSGKRVSAVSGGRRCRPAVRGVKATCTVLRPWAGTSVQVQWSSCVASSTARPMPWRVRLPVR